MSNHTAWPEAWRWQRKQPCLRSYATTTSLSCYSVLIIVLHVHLRNGLVCRSVDTLGFGDRRHVF